MAKKKSSDTSKTKAPEAGETPSKIDAVVNASSDAPSEEFIEDLEDTADEALGEKADTLEGAASQEDNPQEDHPEESKPADDESAASETVEPDAEPEPVPEPEPEPEPAPTPEPAPEPQPVVQHVTEVRQAGFMPLLIGGVVAAALGAGALYATGGVGGGADTSALQESLAAQSAEIDALKAELASAAEANAALEAQIAAIPTVDLSGLEASVTGLSETDSATQDAVSALSAALEETRTRLGELEVQPIPEAVIPEEATAAYERELADMLGTIETRFEEMQAAQAEQLAALEGQITARLAELEALQAEASAAEEAALLAANKGAARAAIAQIEVALESGEGFAPQLVILKDMAGIDAPEALAAVAEEGVTPVTALQAEFPDLARTILSSIPRTAPGAEGGGGLGGFLAAQLGARSLAPREGNDPDAVLSRAEAAVRAGDLPLALTEIAALPEEGQALAADWVAQVTALADARAAADAVTDELNKE